MFGPKYLWVGNFTILACYALCLQYFCLSCSAISGLPVNSTAFAITGQLAGGLIRRSHTVSMAMKHFPSSSCSRWAIILNSSSDISSNVPMGSHSLARVEYNSFTNCGLVGFDIPAEQMYVVVLLLGIEAARLRTVDHPNPNKVWKMSSQNYYV